MPKKSLKAGRKSFGVATDFRTKFNLKVALNESFSQFKTSFRVRFTKFKVLVAKVENFRINT